MAGTPFFVVPEALGTVTSGNELATNLASYLGEHYFAGLTWKSSGASSLYARCNLGSAKAINFCGMLGANAIPATTARLRLAPSQALVDGTPGGGNYDSGALTFIDPAVTDASGLYHWHHEPASSYTKQWARVDIGSHTGDFEAAMLVLGTKVSPAKFYETEWERGYEDLATVGFNRFAVPDFTDGALQRVCSFKMSWLTESEFETSILPMAARTGKSRPLFLCFDPEATTYRQARTYFGFLKESLRPRKVAYNRFESQFDFISLI
jgi:hypothetical protein